MWQAALALPADDTMEEDHNRLYQIWLCAAVEAPSLALPQPPPHLLPTTPPAPRRRGPSNFAFTSRRTWAAKVQRMLAQRYFGMALNAEMTPFPTSIDGKGFMTIDLALQTRKLVVKLDGPKGQSTRPKQIDS